MRFCPLVHIYQKEKIAAKTSSCERRERRHKNFYIILTRYNIFIWEQDAFYSVKFRAEEAGRSLKNVLHKLVFNHRGFPQWHDVNLQQLSCDVEKIFFNFRPIKWQCWTGLLWPCSFSPLSRKWEEQWRFAGVKQERPPPWLPHSPTNYCCENWR